MLTAILKKNAGVYNLSVDKQNLTTVKSTLGVRLNKAISPALNIRASMAVGVENSNDSDIRAKLAGADHFTTQGLNSTNAVGTAGLGVGYAFSPNSRISLDYEGNWRKKYDNQALMLTFNSVF